MTSHRPVTCIMPTADRRPFVAAAIARRDRPDPPAPVVRDPGIVFVAAIRIGGDSSASGWTGIQYWRLHGSPRIYHSAYDLPYLQRLAQTLHIASAEGGSTWCIFDNTASGAAIGNALTLAKELNQYAAPTQSKPSA